MWRVGAACGVAVWLMTIVTSAMINYLAGWQYGRTYEEQLIFGLLGLSADVWKALGPLFVVALWRARRYIGSFVALAVWLVCFAFAVIAALGLAAQIRNAAIGTRDGTISDYAAAQRELAEVERERASRTRARSRLEIERAINQILARPVSGRGTVASLSDECRRDYGRTRDACADVAGLRSEQATAIERERFDDRAHELRQEVARLREQGGSSDAPDAQGQLISRLTFGFVSASDVGLGVTLLMGLMIELISAFAPLVIQEYVAVNASQPAAPGRGTSRPVAARLVSERKGRREVFAYLASRVRPNFNGGVPAARLFADYRKWCGKAGRAAITRGAFHAALKNIAQTDLKGNVRCEGDTYYGLDFVPQPQNDQ